MSNDDKELYRFGHFLLDVGEHRLESSDGETVGSIPEKAFQTLVHLIRRNGSLISKDELLTAVWPDAVVEENNLDKAIHTLRQALGEKTGEQKYIETVRKHGYRFVAPVERVTASGSSTTVITPLGTEIPGLAKPKVTPSGLHVLFDLVNPSEVPTEFLDDVSPEHNNEDEPEPTAEPEPDKPQPVPTPERPFRWVLFAGSGLIILSAILGAAVLWRSGTDPGRLSFSQKRITAAGGTARTTISPKGRHAAVVVNNSLLVFDLESGRERLVVPSVPDTSILKLAFSPDGSQLYYGTKPANQTLVSVFKIPVQGGEPAKILDDVYSSLSFSPDGKKFAFVRRYPELNEYAILTANADGSNINKLASSRLPNRFEGTPEWAPDGATLACSAISVEGGFHFTIARVSTATGKIDFVPDQNWTGINSVVWLPDSENVVLAAQERDSTTAQVWRLNTKTGVRARLVNDPYIYESISGSSDGSQFAAIRVRQSSQVWILGDRPVQLTSGFDNGDGVSGLAWRNTDEILYHSRAGGQDAIWRMRPDGSGASMITRDKTGGFAVSRDGRYLAYQGKQSTGHLGLQLRELDTGKERSLTQNVTAMSPSFFPDGRRIAFSIYDTKLSLYEIAVNGGTPTVLNDEFRAAMVPAVSPSGKLVAFAINRVESGKLQTGIAILDHAEKRVIATFPVKTNATTYEEPTIQWSSDESAVYFVLLVNYVANIMKIDLETGAVSNVTNFNEGRIFNFAVEPGGTRILAARGQLDKEATQMTIDPSSWTSPAVNTNVVTP